MLQKTSFIATAKISQSSFPRQSPTAEAADHRLGPRSEPGSNDRLVSEESLKIRAGLLFLHIAGGHILQV